jgi:hypothetical protein
MDKRKEKYYNYVVNDLVKNTEIVYEKQRINFPYPSTNHFPNNLLHSSPATNHSFFTSPSVSSSFSDHIQGKYGTHDYEVEIIWNLYKQRIEILISNE